MLILNIKDCPVDPAMPDEDREELDKWWDDEDDYCLEGDDYEA